MAQLDQATLELIQQHLDTQNVQEALQSVTELLQSANGAIVYAVFQHLQQKVNDEEIDNKDYWNMIFAKISDEFSTKYFAHKLLILAEDFYSTIDLLSAESIYKILEYATNSETPDYEELVQHDQEIQVLIGMFVTKMVAKITEEIWDSALNEERIQKLKEIVEMFVEVEPNARNLIIQEFESIANQTMFATDIPVLRDFVSQFE